MCRRSSRIGGACAVLGLLVGAACAASSPIPPAVGPPREPPESGGAADSVASTETEAPEECRIELPEPRPFVGRPIPRRICALGDCLRFRPAPRRPEECFDYLLPAAHIKEGLTANRGRILHCYLEALRRDPAVAGRIVVAFTVDDDGAVGEVQVESDAIVDETLASCIGGVVTGLRFLCSAGAVRVRYPVVLTPLDPVR